MSFKVGDIVISTENTDTVYIVVNTDKHNKVDLSVLVWSTPKNKMEELGISDYIYRNIDSDILRKIGLKDLTKRLVNYVLED